MEGAPDNQYTAQDSLGGAVVSYIKTATGVDTLLPAWGISAGGPFADAPSVFDRAVMIVVTVDEVFANGSGAQTTFKIGDTTTDDKFAATTAFTGKAAGTILPFAGRLSSGTDLIITATAATGTGTGAITVTVLAMPAR